MATVYSVQKTKWSQNNPTERINPNEYSGRVRIAYALYEAASLSAGDVMEMFNLPNGARILEGTLTHDALGSSTTLSVGHAAYKNAAGTTVALDVDEYFAAAASTSITTVAVAATAALGRNSEVDANQDGILVTVVLAGAAATGTIELQMLYVVD
jgi:aspartate 1-decarboxylase